MIHARDRARGLEKLIISRKLKSSLGSGARLFLLGVTPLVPPLSSPCSRNGRNFKRKFTNEGDFPRTPPRRFPSRKRRREAEGKKRWRRLRRGKSHGAFPQPFSALHHQRAARDFLEVASPFFFFTSTRVRSERAAGREKWDTAVPTKIYLSTCRDRNCFRTSLAKCVGAHIQILKQFARWKQNDWRAVILAAISFYFHMSHIQNFIFLWKRTLN